MSKKIKASLHDSVGVLAKDGTILLGIENSHGIIGGNSFFMSARTFHQLLEFVASLPFEYRAYRALPVAGDAPVVTSSPWPVPLEENVVPPVAPPRPVAEHYADAPAEELPSLGVGLGACLYCNGRGWIMNLNGTRLDCPYCAPIITTRDEAL